MGSYADLDKRISSTLLKKINVLAVQKGFTTAKVAKLLRENGELTNRDGLSVVKYLEGLDDV